MTSPRIIRHFLLATTLAWGLSASVSRASVADKPLPVLIGELQGMSAEEQEKVFQRINEEISNAPPPEQETKRQWLKAQWAALSPDQRGQLRNQIRDHWQRMSPEQRQQLREERHTEDRSNSESESGGAERQDRQQRLSPDQRLEFRQWMRDRRESGNDDNGARGGQHGGPP